MPVPTLDLVAQHRELAPDLRKAFEAAVSTGQFILGRAVEDFETSLAAFCHASHAVGVSSGTDALLVALMALGVGPGDEVIVPTFTFFATGSCVARLGARPVFVDIDPVTFNLDPAAAERALTPRTKAIIPVHLYGRLADMPPILALARRHNLKGVEDAAQAIGAGLRNHSAGAIGHVGCISVYPTKNLSALGDAGACLTNDPALAEQLRILRLHGMSPRYHHKFIGGNFRIDALQAAFLAIKLTRLEAWNQKRRQLAARYDQLLCGLPITLPAPLGETGHVFHQYTIRVPAARRAAFCNHLKARGIGHDI